MRSEENFQKIIKHIDHNRQTKAYKLTRIERIVLDCMDGGYTDEVLQRILDICREPERVSQEDNQ